MSDERTPTAEPMGRCPRCQRPTTLCDGHPTAEPVTALAADIRAVDGNHDLGASALAEALIERGWSQRSTAEVERLREDAELGRAWRECEAALPVSYMLQIDGAEGWEAVALPFRHEWVTYKGTGDTPTEALDALRAALAEPDHDDG
jgi:hypothetical protein